MPRRKPNTSFNKRKWMFDIIFFFIFSFSPFVFYHNEILVVIIKKAIWECTLKVNISSTSWIVTSSVG